MKWIPIILLFFVFNFIKAQNYSTNDRKAIELFEKALEYYNQGQLETALAIVQKVHERDKNFIEPYLLKADIYHEQNKYLDEIGTLKKVIEINPSFNEKIFLMLGKAEYKTGNYPDAVEHFNHFIEVGQVHNEIAEAKNWLRKAEFAAYAIEHPVPFDPVLLSTNINSPYKDYWPSLTIDEQELYYTVQLPTNQRSPYGDMVYQEDLFVSKKGTDGKWQASKNIGPPINTDDNEGSQSISANGQFLFYVACNRKVDFGSCDIYYSEKAGNGWTKPKNIGQPINSTYWESTPSASADGRMLFFSSGIRPDSKGGKDIYVSYKRDDGSWTTPQNLGDSINSKGNEYAPFIHPDGKTLYFSSDGWTGMGGQDIFFSRMKDDSTWTTPKNLGYPINTSFDDFGLIVNGSGQYAFFSSNRKGSQDWDLYTFELYPEAQPNPVTYVKGKVFDIKTKEPLLATVEIIDLEKDQTIYKAPTIMPQGTYIACIPLKSNYAMNVSAQGYLFYSENFTLEKVKKVDKSYIIDVPLQPIEPGSVVVLKNIFYETDKFQLKKESEIELKKLINLLQKNPGLCIEISGHTDNVGGLEHNKSLSTNRAKTVYEYLIQHGIKAERLKYAGYAYSKPLADNNTAEGRALNRRTEFKVLAINKP
jgi:outer membrane protein OmpA-like peptidoglycan-associated protein